MPDNRGFGAGFGYIGKNHHRRSKKHGCRKYEIGTEFILIHVTNLCGSREIITILEQAAEKTAVSVIIVVAEQ